MNITEQASDFLDEKRRKKAPATYEQYRFVLEDVFLPWCAKAKITQPDEVTDKALDRFTEYLQARVRIGRDKQPKPLSVDTVRTYVRTARIFLKWAGVARGRYEQPRKPQRIREVLSREEIDRLERAATDERDRLVVRVLADTGIRVSELLGLRRVDLREGAHDRSTFIRVVGKGDKEREVAMPRPVFKRLQTFAAYCEPGDYIFQSKRHRAGGKSYGRLTRSGVGQLVRNLAIVAKVTTRTSPHAMRHAYCTHLLLSGVNPVLVQKSMGHTTLAMVSQTYSHITASDSYEQLMSAFR